MQRYKPEDKGSYTVCHCEVPYRKYYRPAPPTDIPVPSTEFGIESVGFCFTIIRPNK